MSEPRPGLRFGTWLAVTLTVIVGATAVVLLVAGQPDRRPAAPPAAAPPPVQTLTLVPVTPTPTATAATTAPAVVARTSAAAPPTRAQPAAPRVTPTPGRPTTAAPPQAPSVTPAKVVVVPVSTPSNPLSGPIERTTGTVVLLDGAGRGEHCLALSDGAGLLLLTPESDDHQVVFALDRAGQVIESQSGIVEVDYLTDATHLVASIGRTVSVVGRSQWSGVGGAERCGSDTEMFFSDVTAPGPGS